MRMFAFWGRFSGFDWVRLTIKTKFVVGKTPSLINMVRNNNKRSFTMDAFRIGSYTALSGKLTNLSFLHVQISPPS